jgi:hypothetical protein
MSTEYDDAGSGLAPWGAKPGRERAPERFGQSGEIRALADFSRAEAV